MANEIANQTLGIRRAVIGDGVTSNPYTSKGLVKVRLYDGEGADGSLALGGVIEVLPGGGVKIQPNQKVWLRALPGAFGGAFQIVSIDFDDAVFSSAPLPASKVDTSSQPARIFLRNIQDGMTFPAVNSSQALTTKIASERGILYVAPDGTLQSQTIPASGLDLASAFVTAENTMRDVLIYHDPISYTNSYVQNDSATLDEGRMTLAQAQALVDELPHQYVKRRQAYRLKWYQSVVTQRNIMLDLRAFENEVLPSGMPNRISRNWLILDTERILSYGTFTPEAGKTLTIQGEVTVL